MVSGAPHRYAVEERNLALVRAIGTPRRVLDVGCGVGLNGAVAKGRGASVVGLELAETASAMARSRLDEVLPVDVESDASVATLGDRTFDLVLLGDVLEHLRDPAAALARLLPHLEEEGRVLISVPNVAAWTIRAELLAGRFDYEPSGILDETHLRFFTRASIVRLVEDAGLEVLRVEQNPHVVRAAKRLVIALRSRNGHGIPHDPLALMRSWPYQCYLATVRPFEDALARLAPELLSFQHVVVARKPPRPRKLSLTVGMLTMNEAESIAPMIDAVRAVAPDAEILCVDSSTRDATAEIAAAKGARVLRQVPARGHGPAMERLMNEAAARTDALVYLDCDFTYPTERIPAFRKMLEEECVDVVNGARTRTRPEAMPVPNFVANRVFAALARATAGVPTCDVHSGMRAYRSSVIRAFDFDGEGDALPIDTLLWPAKSGYRVAEVGIPYEERVGASKLRKLAGTAWTFVRLVRTLPVGERGGSRWAKGRFEVRT
jgi:2-polyprenyl-3-methyl-5-hydroxy-6-metoxy-1,4-benzoquinol methylase